jgi:ElaB/YqjD/DUF883 family membrane-anchored ribosome-binding protein
MKKKIGYIFVVFVLVLIGFFVIEHAILVSITKTALRYVVRMDTHMNRVSLNPVTGCITVRGFKIYNPPGFKERVLADVPLITMDFKAKTLLENGIFFDNITVNIKEINVIKNKENQTNVSQMKAFSPAEKPKEKLPFLADRYDVQIEKIKVIDYTQGDEAVTKEVDLNIQESYKKVKNPDTVIKAIGFKLYFNGKLKNIGFNIKRIQSELAKLAEENKKLRKEIVKATQERIEKTKKIAEGAITATKKAIQDTAKGVQDKAGEAKEIVSEKSEKTKEIIHETIETVKQKVSELNADSSK